MGYAILKRLIGLVIKTLKMSFFQLSFSQLNLGFGSMTPIKTDLIEGRPQLNWYPETLLYIPCLVLIQIQYIILNNWILKLNSEFSITFKQGIHFTVNSLGSIWTNWLINERISSILTVKWYTVCIRTRVGMFGQIYPFGFKSSLGLWPWELHILIRMQFTIIYIFLFLDTLCCNVEYTLYSALYCTLFYTRCCPIQYTVPFVVHCFILSVVLYCIQCTVFYIAC